MILAIAWEVYGKELTLLAITDQVLTTHQKLVYVDTLVDFFILGLTFISLKPDFQTVIQHASEFVLRRSMSTLDIHLQG